VPVVRDPSPGPDRRPDGPRWTTVSVRAEGPDVELVADLLWGHGPAAVEERADAEGTLLLAGFDTPAAADRAVLALHDAGARSAFAGAVVDDGLDAWRAHARVERAGPFLVVPAWLPDVAAGPDDLVVRIEPGRTFGSGSHPTTRLVLAEVARRARPGARVLDVGCGSGVLAVGAALAGAAEVVAIDVDPAAGPVTEANARANGVADRVAWRALDLAGVAGSGDRFDLVAANLLAPVVIELAADLVRVVAPGGALVVSGLLADRWQQAVGALAGVEVETVTESEGWVAVAVRRQDSPAGTKARATSS
jgi:ribosomal protein L11 methyltransferase